MRLVEEHNPELSGVLPRTYTSIENSTIASLLRHINSYTKDLEGDAFGLIYEYFLAKFALAEGQGAGEFFTPMSIVRLIVEIIEPFHGRIFDPACGSGGMFVHSAHFVERHRKSAGEELSIYGQEKTAETVRLAKMNLAVHGLSGEIREGNSYYEDLHDSVGRFDFVMANPPFNVDRIDKAKLGRRPALPRSPESRQRQLPLDPALRHRAQRPRPRRLRDGQLRVGRAPQRGRDPPQADRGPSRRRDGRVGPNFFYTVTLPVTLWFLDRAKRSTRSRRRGALHRRAPDLPSDRPRPSRLHRRAARVPRQHRAPLPGRGARGRGGQERAHGRAVPRWRLRRCSGALQGRDR